ncbi:uncharacterized protein TA18590 [Theileria annulata]|uniref:Uncharacterized protein n=1 Tax=Theileria annulata TaxID=5874 RepID=Q4UBH0_THEAN|nr:uncharacterized protein TA18590 [Theileria annulata]CAI75831.1 hypothetical protein TA18590 [Theileria annulata]|eukprot:XP_955307.1 hypothetical protein TA18590 [Theileria annulata]
MWILRYKVETHSVNGSILESVCLSILSTIETIGSDSLVVYLFEDSFCSSVLNEFKGLNSCFQIVVGNLKRVYNNKLIFDENKWFEDEEEEEFELKNKIINEGLQDQLISLYNTCDDDQWILNKKHQSDIYFCPELAHFQSNYITDHTIVITTVTYNSVENVKSEVEINNKITVKLKPKKDEKTLVEEFLLDIQDSDK